MSRAFLLAALAAAGLLVAAAPSTAVAGPPWISIELPANPLNATTRGAYLLVRTYHHADAVTAPLTGRAIGLVNGKRQSVTLEFERTSVPGVYALRRTWPTEGSWALAIHLGEGTEGAASALVGVAADGEVRSVKVPTQTADGHTWPRAASRADIERVLATVAAMPGEPRPERDASVGALMLLPLGLGLGYAVKRVRGA